MSFRRTVGRQFSPGGLSKKKTPSQKLQAKLDRAWRDFLWTRSQYRRGKMSREELQASLDRLKRLQRKTGAPLMIPERELLDVSVETGD